MLDVLLTLAVLASTTLTILLLLFPTRYIKHSPPKASGTNAPKVSVQVLVLGDIGRSPRMQYHAMSIAKHGGRVDLIGYHGILPVQWQMYNQANTNIKHKLDSAVHPEISKNPLITIVPLAAPPKILKAKILPFIIAGPLKVLWQITTLFHTLSYRIKPARWLLVQNPPSIPTLFLALIICCLRNTHLIIDWHNYGWTILAGTRGPIHPFVYISKFYEVFLGRYAPTANLTVTHAMERQLKEIYNITSPIFTLHDRPAGIFQPVREASIRRKFLARLEETREKAEQIMSGGIKLLVSSTSWTPDEDFGLLLDALKSYSALSTSTKTSNLPPILAIITGKGPQKEHYLRLISDLTSSFQLTNIEIKTAWLTTEDYALLLACADLGVCLHKSSSGVDLPMKVVDMFGAGLPVTGYADYESWGELVKEGLNGKGFVDGEGLKVVLVDLFSEGKGGNGEELKRLKQGALEEGNRSWNVKIGDFGSTILDGTPPAENVVEKIRYELPLRGRTFQERLYIKREIFALRSAIYEIMSWKMPFEELDDDVVEKMYAAEKSPDITHLLVGNIIHDCWNEKFDTSKDVENGLDGIQRLM
ncbi:hypothetical protein B7494_g5227 [Chlorociboria aeruginascens]|nr:hypothetical protein B7494_g5227 [Chlorociboria aeruginascens]